MLPEVQVAVSEAFHECFANSASSHLLGEVASRKVDCVREQLADSIGAYPSEIVFTSGATESNNIALKSVLLGSKELQDKKHVIISAIEHKCMFAICDYLQSLGYEISIAKPNSAGVINRGCIEPLLRPETALVSVMHANNELGTVNPIAEIGELCFSRNILFHSDAAQSFCKTPIDVDDMNVDIMSFSAHKIGGPKGIGAIYIRDLRKRDLQPVIHGAGQEQGLRGGTVATPLIVGFGEAQKYFKLAFERLREINPRLYLISKLEEENIPFIVNGKAAESLENILSLTLPKTNANLLVRENENIFCLAQGSACSSKEIEASHVLSALGLSRELGEHTFRVSFTHEITYQDINTLVGAIKKAAV